MPGILVDDGIISPFFGLEGFPGLAVGKVFIVLEDVPILVRDISGGAQVVRMVVVGLELGGIGAVLGDEGDTPLAIDEYMEDLDGLSVGGGDVER